MDFKYSLQLTFELETGVKRTVSITGAYPYINGNEVNTLGALLVEKQAFDWGDKGGKPVSFLGGKLVQTREELKFTF